VVENNTLGRVVALSIWHCYCFIKSAAAAYALNESAEPKPTQSTRVPLIPR